MASLAFASSSSIPYRRLSIGEIDAVISARLRPTRIHGNAQPACFNRQVAMYLAKHLAGWSTTMIGRFYNGRDHSTVIHSIQRIEALRESDPDLDALLSELNDQLTRRQDGSGEKKVFEAPTKVPYASYITSTNLLRL
ncbi:MAG: hypothetical protein JO108_36505 [Acidobacteriaceae bacterium]|nr:hypothetical protein [Acidobacteriaceae bacterium]